jgi:hypothetical protein
MMTDANDMSRNEPHHKHAGLDGFDKPVLFCESMRRRATPP